MAIQVTPERKPWTWPTLLLLTASLVVAVASPPLALAGGSPCFAEIEATPVPPVATFDFHCGVEFNEVYITTTEPGMIGEVEGTCTPNGVSRTFRCQAGPGGVSGSFIAADGNVCPFFGMSFNVPAGNLYFDEFSIEGCPTQPECAIRGTPGNEILRGTPGTDTICAGRGNDIVYGLGGNDILRGGDGNDILRGGDGNDRLDGERGNDHLRGGRGNDRLTGGTGRDILSGGDGEDDLDSVDGEQGNDVVNGGSGADSCPSDPRDLTRSCQS